MFGSFVTIFLKSSTTLPESHQNFFLFLWVPKYFACIYIYYASSLTVLLSTKLDLVFEFLEDYTDFRRNSLPLLEVRQTMYLTLANEMQMKVTSHSAAEAFNCQCLTPGPVFCSPKHWAMLKEKGPHAQRQRVIGPDWTGQEDGSSKWSQWALRQTLDEQGFFYCVIPLRFWRFCTHTLPHHNPV